MPDNMRRIIFKSSVDCMYSLEGFRKTGNRRKMMRHTSAHAASIAIASLLEMPVGNEEWDQSIYEDMLVRNQITHPPLYIGEVQGTLTELTGHGQLIDWISVYLSK